MDAFGESISFDQRLYRHDIRGSIAHAEMLASVGLLSEQEADLITETLREIEKELALETLGENFIPLEVEMIKSAQIFACGFATRLIRWTRN